MKIYSLFIVLMTYTLLLNLALANNQTSSMSVTATVGASCTISAGNLDFGNFSGAQTDASASITVNCTSGASYTVDMDAGTGSGATTTTRKLTSGADTLDYTVYSDNARTSIWKTGGGNNVSGTGSGANQTLTAYGRMPANATPAAGSYTDSITVTINY